MLFKSSAIAAAILFAAKPVTSNPETDCIGRKFEEHFSKGFPNVLADATLRIERASTGEVIYSKDVDKTFEVMSITKLFVGTVFNQLFDEGKVWYKDPFVEYLPEGIDTSDWCTTGDVHSITIRDLLRMTSGLQDIWDTDTAFYQAWGGDDPDALKDVVWTPQLVLDYVPQLQNHCRTGGSFSYSDTNFLILGIIIEHVTGNKLAREIRTRVLDRVNMPNTFMLHYESKGGSPVRASCDVPYQSWIGDGWCDDDWGDFNTAECNFDGGDCCDYTCNESTKYGCTKGTSKDVACKVNKPFYNEGGYTTLWRSFTADWGGSGYVSTAEDLAKFIKVWYNDPHHLFCPGTSRCRMTSSEMMRWDEKDGYGYSMGMEMTSFNDKFGYGHSGINNSFMFYVAPNGLVVTGTLNWYDGVQRDGDDADIQQWHVVNDMLSCIGTSGNDNLHDCPGERSNWNTYASHYFQVYSQCNRACEVWNWAGWEQSECQQKCQGDSRLGDARWDDHYVTCLERNKNCLSGGDQEKKNKIMNDVCEWESGCPNTCLNDERNWWHCIPQCEQSF